ncbi:MAG: hypothetical protein K1X92_16580 [Bacteroidia bacterium]|nr:hypothetical protein [Bacteroidia bacterium]
MNLNWKDILIVGAFLAAAIFIALKFTGSPSNTHINTETTNISNTPALENAQIADNTGTNVSPVAENVKTENIVTPEGISVNANERTIESPISKTSKESAATAKTEGTSTEKTPSASPEAAKPATPKPATDTKAATKPKDEMKPKVAVTPAANQRTIESAPATTTKPVVKPQNTAPYPGGTYYLIAASRENFEEAQKSFDQFKSLGYNPIMLSPVKSRGINNYRIAIYRNADKKSVEDYSGQINGKSAGYWIDQR